MNYSADLETVLRFVIRRIEEEAVRSGQPLTEEQSSLLNDLPAEPMILDTDPHDFESPPLMSPRDMAFERLCELTKAGYGRDLELNPANCGWQFAKAVTELHRHPMSWLMGWAGVKCRRAWWDGWLLLVAALVSISVWMLLFFVGIETRIRFRWLIAAFGCASVVWAMWFGTRQLEKFHQRQMVEKYRRGSS
jgi:hypothetical protein